jgi:hypothetical protein
MGSYGYAAQFEKFGVGIGLKTPGEIAGIPAKLSEHQNVRFTEGWWQEIAPERFRELLERKARPVSMHAD